MAKEFKDFDKKYSFLKGKLLSREPQPIMLNGLETLVGDMIKPSHADIAHAVYNSVGAEQWQMFRVSLKGWSTQAKLGRLWARWMNYVLHKRDGEEQAKLERVRIVNYLDSMKRSGLLDQQLRAIK